MDYDLYTTFVCHNEPTYLLSRNCTSEYYVAAGICCKVDESINYLVNVRPDFFKGIKYMLHSDDDTYWRPDQVLKWLAAVENSGASKYPLISNVQIGDDNNKGVWMIQNCEEIHTSGWYQPTMLNHAALAKMGAAAAAYGNRDTCKAFDISQDVGIGIFAWLFATNHIVMPGTNMNGDHKGIGEFKPTDIAIHYTKHHEEDRCDGKADNGWPHQDRYSQNMVVGCGDIGRPVHGHDKSKRADMYDAWEYFRLHGKDITVNKVGVNEFIESYVVVDADGKVQHVAQEKLTLEAGEGDTFKAPAEGLPLIDKVVHMLAPGEKIVRRVIPRLMPMRGYDTTNHSKENDITKKWKAFTLQDCNPPGIKQH